MNRFNENDKVLVKASRVPWDEVSIGTVEMATYNPGLEVSMYLVRLASGDLVKCLDEDLEEVEEENVEETVEEKDVESITITKKDFTDVSLDMNIGGILFSNLEDPLLVLRVIPAVAEVMVKTREALFERYSKND